MPHRVAQLVFELGRPSQDTRLHTFSGVHEDLTKDVESALEAQYHAGGTTVFPFVRVQSKDGSQLGALDQQVVRSRFPKLHAAGVLQV